MFSDDRPLPPFSFEPLSPSPRDVIVSDSDFDSEAEPQQRSAKRRRVEDIARQYVAGQPIYILSATLGGPFNGNWANPWSKISEPGVRGSKPSHVKRAMPKKDSNPRNTRSIGAQGEQYPRRSNATANSVDKSGSRRELVARNIEGFEEHRLDNKGSKLDRGMKQREQDYTHESSGWTDEYDRKELDDQGASSTVARISFFKPEDKAGSKRDGKSTSTGTWLRTVEGSTYPHLRAQNDTTSPFGELIPTSSPKRTYSKRKQQTRPLDTSPQGVSIMTANHSVRDLDDVDEPMELASESAVRSTKLVNPGKNSDAEQKSGCAVLLSTQEEGARLVIRQTDLVGASADTIHSWMRAKELSVLAASQASQAASFRQSQSSLDGRGIQSKVEAVEDADLVPQPTFSTRIYDSKDNSLKRLSHSQPGPLKSKLFDQDSAAASIPAQSSPNGSVRKSFRVVSPSTDLPGFRYWRPKSATAHKSPSEDPGTRNRASVSKFESSGADPASSDRSDGALPREKETVTLNKVNVRDSARQNAMFTGNDSAAIPTPVLNTRTTTNSIWPKLKAAISEKRPAGKLRKLFTSSTASEPPEGEAGTVSRKNTDIAQILADTGLVESTTPVGHATHEGMAGAAIKDENASETTSPPLDEPSLSTQAAVADMLRRFQAEIETPAQQKLATPANLQSSRAQHEQEIGISNGKPTTRSPLFKERGRGLRTPSADQVQPGKTTPEKEFISTQMLLDAASPFEFSTIMEEKRIPASASPSAEHPERTRELREMAGKSPTSPETPASASQRRISGRVNRPSQSRSVKKKGRAPATPGDDITSFISDMSMKSPSAGEDDAVEVNDTINEMMGSILQGWDVETELRKSAGSNGVSETGESGGKRKAS